MSKLFLIAALIPLSALAFPKDEWAQGTSTVATVDADTTIWVNGDAAKKLYSDLIVKEMPLQDDDNTPSGAVKQGSAISCYRTEGGLRFQCEIRLVKSTGALRK